MSEQPDHSITLDMLPRIEAVAREAASKSAAGSLALWGVINTGAWLFLGRENRAFLSTLTDTPTGGMWYLLYGSLAFGVAMLVCAAFGYATRNPATILLNGFALMTIGISNTVNDFVANQVMRPYGYQVERVQVLWIVLGLSQIVWGWRQFSTYARTRDWSPADMSPDDMVEMRNRLRAFCGLQPNAADGVIKATATTGGVLGMGFMSQTVSYTGKLLDDTALMVSNGLDTYFELERATACEASTAGVQTLDLQLPGGQKGLTLTAASVLVFREWCGQPVTVADIKRVGPEKTGTLSLLRRYIDADDVDVRCAAISALGAPAEPEVGEMLASLVDDQDAMVAVAALGSCARLQIVAVEDRAISFLSAPESVLRIAAARYLALNPSEKGQAAVERAVDTEADKEVQKETRKAQKKLRAALGQPL